MFYYRIIMSSNTFLTSAKFTIKFRDDIVVARTPTSPPKRKLTDGTGQGAAAAAGSAFAALSVGDKRANHFYGRGRNCYSIAVRKVHRALVYATKGRKLKKEDIRDLWTTRTTAACEELGLPFQLFRKGLQSSGVLLNRKSLSNLAIWEPRTFKALTDFSWKRAEEDGLNEINSLAKDPPAHVVTREMLKKKE